MNLEPSMRAAADEPMSNPPSRPIGEDGEGYGWGV